MPYPAITAAPAPTHVQNRPEGGPSQIRQALHQQQQQLPLGPPPLRPPPTVEPSLRGPNLIPSILHAINILHDHDDLIIHMLTQCASQQ